MAAAVRAAAVAAEVVAEVGMAERAAPVVRVGRPRKSQSTTPHAMMAGRRCSPYQQTMQLSEVCYPPACYGTEKPPVRMG